MTALPFLSIPTRAFTACWPAAERVWTALRAPVAERARASTREQPDPPQLIVASARDQTKTALPLGSTATLGVTALCPAAERVWTALRAPAAERVRAWT